MMMHNWEVPNIPVIVARNYIDQLADNPDSEYEIRREFEQVIRETQRLIKAISLLTQHGFTVR